VHDKNDERTRSVVSPRTVKLTSQSRNMVTSWYSAQDHCVLLGTALAFLIKHICLKPLRLLRAFCSEYLRQSPHGFLKFPSGIFYAINDFPPRETVEHQCLTLSKAVLHMEPYTKVRLVSTFPPHEESRCRRKGRADDALSVT